MHCALDHRLKLGADVTQIVCDKVLIRRVVKQIVTEALQKRRNSGDLGTWRRMLAYEWSLYAGDSTLAPKQCITASEFLSKYEIPHASAHVESGMTALHYAGYEDNGKIVKPLLESGACLHAEEEDGMPCLASTCFADCSQAA